MPAKKNQPAQKKSTPEVKVRLEMPVPVANLLIRMGYDSDPKGYYIKKHMDDLVVQMKKQVG